MARLVRSIGPAPRSSRSCSPLLAGDLYFHYLAYRPLQLILHHPDLHDELYHTVSGQLVDGRD